MNKREGTPRQDAPAGRAFAIGGLLIALLLALALPAMSHASGGQNGNHGRWKPKATTAPWQWQLQGHVKTNFAAGVYEIDGFDTPKSKVTQLHKQGRKVICYLDVGSWESYRSDASQFPRSVIGRKYEGFPDERWLDIRRFHEFSGILKHRFNMCAKKGFDAVEPDNIAGWENRTGFPIKRGDQLKFNRWVARQVHGRGMSVALKNDGRQAKQLVGNFDFAVVEQCFQYHECGVYRTFIKHDKPVFEAEYEIKPKQFCKTARAIGFSAIRKSYDLYAKPWVACGRTGKGHSG